MADEYELPKYDYLDTPILLGTDEAGNYLVHEQVDTMESLAGIFDDKASSGTGEFKSDKVSAYSEREFQDKFVIKGGYVPLDRYIEDATLLQPARLEMGNDTPIVTAADLMKTRIVEIGKDREAYEQSLNSPLPQEEVPQSVPAPGT